MFSSYHLTVFLSPCFNVVCGVYLKRFFAFSIFAFVLSWSPCLEGFISSFAFLPIISSTIFIPSPVEFDSSIPKLIISPIHLSLFFNT